MSTSPPGEGNTPPSSPPRYDTAELERRREELAAQVAELHWDLGGLAYEMAIRDHFRNDVLLSRAAQLQELDAELAEVERKLGDERALGDGARRRGRRARAWARVLPPAQISALLLVAFLGFGVADGRGREGLARAARVRPARCWSPRRRPPRGDGGRRRAAKASPPASEPEATPSASSEPTNPASAGHELLPGGQEPRHRNPRPAPRARRGSSGGGEGSSGGGGGEAGSPVDEAAAASSTCSW